MAKGKVTIELEGGESVTYEFDDMHMSTDQTLYRFYNLGELTPEEMAPDGEIRINIKGTRVEAQKNFERLRCLYSYFERMGG